MDRPKRKPRRPGWKELDNRATAEIEEQLREERRDAEARRKRVKLGDVAHDAAASADVDVAPDEEADAAGAAKDDSANTSSDEAFAAVVAANEADDATAEAASVAQQQAADYWKEVMVMARASQFPPPPGIAQMLGAMSNQAAIAEKLPVDEAAAGVSATTEPPLDLTIGKPTPPEEREIFEGSEGIVERSDETESEGNVARTDERESEVADGTIV